MSRRSPSLKGVPKPLPFEVRRTALLKRLAHPDLRLALLTAPAGHGKTTLLGQAARETEATVAWLTCTEDDANPITLLRSIAASVNRIAPRLRLGNWRDAGKESATPLLQAQRLAEDLNASSGNLWLVLDRCERLSPDAGRALDSLVASLGEGHRVLMSGYEIPGAPVSQWLARGDAILLVADNLCFTVQETKNYVRLRGVSADAAQVHVSVSGWPAGVALGVGTEDYSYSPETLVLEVLERLPDTLRRTLPVASVLSVWSEAEASRFDLGLPRGWMRQVVQAGLPLTPLGQGRHRPHSLLVRVLEAEFAGFPQGQLIHHRVAEDLEARGETMTAVRHFVTAGAAPRAVALIEHLVPQLMRFNQHDVAASLIRTIPDAYHSARVRVFFGWLHIVAGQTQEAVSVLRPLYAQGVRDGYLWWLLSMAEHVLGDFETQIRFTTEGLELETDSELWCLICVSHVIGLQRLDRFAEGFEFAKRGYDRATQLGDNLLILRLASVLLFSLAELRREHETKRLARDSIALAERCGFLTRKRELVGIYTDYCAIWGEFDEAIALVEPYTRETSALSGSFLYVYGACHYRTHRDLARAVECFEQGLAVDRGAANTYMVFRHLLWLADIALLSGDLQLAESRLSEALEVATPLSAAYEQRAEFIQKRVWLAKGDFERAQATLDGEPVHIDLWDLPRARLYQAQVAWRLGRLEREAITAVFRDLEKVGHDLPLITDRVVLNELYRECIQRDWFAQRFEAALGADTAQHPRPDPRPVLRLNTFGAFELRVSDTLVRLPLTKSEELLAHLVLNGVTRRETLIDAVFGEARGSRNLEYFKVAVRRLRAVLMPMLSFDPITVSSGMYGLSEGLRVECDALALLNDTVSVAPEAVLDWLESFKGEFLPKLESGWVVTARQRLLDARFLVALRVADDVRAGQPGVAHQLESLVARLELDGYV